MESDNNNNSSNNYNNYGNNNKNILFVYRTRRPAVAPPRGEIGRRWGTVYMENACGGIYVYMNNVI